MATKARKHSPSRAAPEPDAGWAQVTWRDIEDWAGKRSTSRGRTYHRQNRVESLAITQDHRLLAKVAGSESYRTSVQLRDAREPDEPLLDSICSCPVGADACKHAVAVVAEYLVRLSKGLDVPASDADPQRWVGLKSERVNIDAGDDGGTDGHGASGTSTPGQRARGDWKKDVRRYVQAQSPDGLAEMICSLADRVPELKESIQEHMAVEKGDGKRLIAQARKELRRVTGEEAWRNNWTGECHLPSYDKLRRQLQRLAELGLDDDVVALGRELIERGLAQVETSNDEGDTAAELGGCLPVVFLALARSGLAPAQKLLYAIDASLSDDFDVVDGAIADILKGDYQTADWSDVAKELSSRLPRATPRSKSRRDDWGEMAADFTRNYKRDRLTDWLGTALERAGRDSEALDLYRTEARTTASYERLVRYLIRNGAEDEALRWASEGIAKTAAHLPGLAQNLAGQLSELARTRGQWDIVAAHTACVFFLRPSHELFDQLMITAEKAGCAAEVRACALRFLETGIEPGDSFDVEKDRPRTDSEPRWPLPALAYLTHIRRSADRRRGSEAPRHDVLIDMAIAQKKPEDVLRWYDEYRARIKRTPHLRAWPSSDLPDRVATAVASTHPECAIEIYRTQIERHLVNADRRAYEAVASYLRKLQPILNSLGRELELAAIVLEIRTRHGNRPRLMDILDRFENYRPLSRSKI